MSTINSVETAGELLGSSGRVIVHSGNIASWSKLRKRGALTSTAELVSATEAAFKSWLGRPNERSEYNDLVVVRNAALCRGMNETGREDILFTLKVYPQHWGSEQEVVEAVTTTLMELGLSSIATLILALPPSSSTDVTLDQIRPLWEGVESLVRSGVVNDVGTADLDKRQFEQLYEWASVKPKVNQVNLAHCCTIPEDMVEFAKAHNVRLMTHNDDRDILPQTQLQTTLDSTLGGQVDHTHWSTSWITKYTSVIKLRGIIAHKGYLVDLSTENN